jgi:PKD repeat protein/archaellum component FlaF (FlaF/FlaG flagellin family)
VKRRKNLGLSTVFAAVLMLILVITVASILFFTLHSFGYATQEALNFEEKRMREKMSLISLTTENISGTEYVTSLLVNNTGSITCRIRGIYIDSELLCDPAESTNTYINPSETKRIIIPLDKWPIYEPTSTITISSERGIKSTEYEMVLKEGGGEPPTYETKFYFGPLMLDFDQFYYTECDSSGSFDPTSWKPGWKVEIKSGSIVWNITVKNVDDRNITINQFSCFTLFPNKSPSNRRAWYLEPAEAPYTQFIQVNETVHLIYIWDRAKLENPKPQDIYSTVCRCKVFLTFFGIFHEHDGTTKPYGQTIPFEAVRVVTPPLSISADPPILPYPNMESTITATVEDSGIPIENANVSFTTDFGTLSAPWALTTTDGVATVTFYYSGSPGTATITATWQGTSESTTVFMNVVPVASFTETAHTVPTNELINFDASASYDSDGTITSYNWDFGDGNTATGITVSHTYSDNGSYSVTLTVTDNSGATDSADATKTIINRPPVASFTETAETVNTDEPITFDASDSSDPDGSIVNYSWDFGDGATGTGVSVQHAYSQEGTYTVTLTVTDDDGATDTTSATKTVLNRIPIASFTESAETVSIGETIHFNASESYDPDGTIVSYSWDFGDGNTATGFEVDHAYEDDGIYTVTLTVIDDDGATGSATATKTVLNQPPLPLFTMNGSTNETFNIPINSTVTFDASASYDPDGDITVYYWDFGDSTDGSGLALDHTYSNAGTFYVTLTVTDDDNETVTSDAKTVVVG